MSYGDLLKEARTRRGLDLGTLSRRLRIRADILASIEDEQFDRLPARGYVKNMVRAYAREVGIDERRVGDMFMRDYMIYENGGSMARPSVSNRGAEGERSSRGARVIRMSGPDSNSTTPRSSSRSASLRNSGGERSARSSRGAEGHQPSSSRRQSGRTSSQSNAQKSRRTSRSSSSGVQPRVSTKPSSSKKSGLGFALPSLDFLPFGKSKQNTATPGLGYVGAQARPKGGMGGSKGAGLNPIALILGAIVVVLVISIVVVLFNSSAKKAETVPSIPISGLTDTSDTSGESTAVSSEPQAPTSAKFEYSVASGGEAWIEIYENGSDEATYAGVVDGPKTESFDVVGTLTFQTANVTPVTLKVDDVVVEPTSDDSGYYVYTVNFPEILAQWQKENLTTSSSSSTLSSSSA